MLNRIITVIKSNYKDDCPESYYYDNGKYLERALTNYGTELIPEGMFCSIDTDEKQTRQSPIGKIFKTQDDDKMDFKEHLTNLLAYHKDEKPLKSLLGYFQQSDEIIASYICCEIAIYTAIYSYKETESKEENFGYADDYNGERCMEDLFLYVL